jgi:hypothetical protein
MHYEIFAPTPHTVLHHLRSLRFVPHVAVMSFRFGTPIIRFISPRSLVQAPEPAWSVFTLMQSVEEKRTPLLASMDELAHKLSVLSFGVIGIICLIGVIQGRGWLEMFTIGGESTCSRFGREADGGQ